jgi:hypothetical protein
MSECVCYPCPIPIRDGVEMRSNTEMNATMSRPGYYKASGEVCPFARFLFSA